MSPGYPNLTSQKLSDLVNAGQGLTALFQVRVARVDVGALGERGVVMPGDAPQASAPKPPRSRTR
jgi:hypothetical protein